MQAWQAWKLSLVRQEGVDASSFCLAGGRGGVLMIGVTFCTVDGVDMEVQRCLPKWPWSELTLGAVRDGLIENGQINLFLQRENL